MRKKYIWGGFLCMALAGCGGVVTRDSTTSLSHIRGLEDCTLIVLDVGSMSPKLKVIRCANSVSTSTMHKSSRDVTLIEHKE